MMTEKSEGIWSTISKYFTIYIFP